MNYFDKRLCDTRRWFWFICKCCFKGFDSFPEIDPSVREAVNAQYEKLGIYLQEQLKALDFEYFETITKDPQTLQNCKRMMRFVEVCIGAGQPYSSLNQKIMNAASLLFSSAEAERSVMYNRIKPAREHHDERRFNGKLKYANC
jgi:tRNA A37 N6-isopentenylltransferase MiaA